MVCIGIDEGFLMADDGHVLELLPAYALDSLEQAEARRVADHLAGCTICRRELSAYQQASADLAFTAPEAVPSAELKARLMGRIQASSPVRSRAAGRRFPSRLIPLGGMIALILIVGLALSTLLLWYRLDRLEVLAGPRGMRAISLQNTNAAPEASGFVIIGADGLNGALVVDRLPPLDPGREYQLWLVRDGINTSAAVFSVDESGYRGVRIQAPETLFAYSAVRVTLEPSGGSPAATGLEVLGGPLFNP